MMLTRVTLVERIAKYHTIADSVWACSEQRFERVFQFDLEKNGKTS